MLPSSVEETDKTKQNNNATLRPNERDPLLRPTIRVRRSASKSPNTMITKSRSLEQLSSNNEGYQAIDDETTLSGRQSHPDNEEDQQQQRRSVPSADSSRYARHRLVTSSRSIGGSTNHSTDYPVLEIPEEIYSVRKAALQVLKPLTKTWVSVWLGVIGCCKRNSIGRFVDSHAINRW